MESILIVLALLLAFAAIYAVFKMPKCGKYICGLSFAFIVYHAARGVWPADKFYIEEINDYANIDLPVDTKVVFKQASYPDFHGDYHSEAVFKVFDFDQAIFPSEKPDVTCTIPEEMKRAAGVEIKDAVCWNKDLDIDRHITIVFSAANNVLYYYYFQH